MNEPNVCEIISKQAYDKLDDSLKDKYEIFTYISKTSEMYLDKPIKPIQKKAIQEPTSSNSWEEYERSLQGDVVGSKLNIFPDHK